MLRTQPLEAQGIVMLSDRSAHRNRRRIFFFLVWAVVQGMVFHLPTPTLHAQPSKPPFSDLKSLYEAVADLELTGDQKSDLKRLQAETRKEVEQLNARGKKSSRNPLSAIELVKRRRALYRETGMKAWNVLTEKQKKQLLEKDDDTKKKDAGPKPPPTQKTKAAEKYRYYLDLVKDTPPPTSAHPFWQPEDSSSAIRATTIDHRVRAGLRDENLNPSPLCSDEVFLRRVFIDLTGTLPGVEETLAFLKDERPDKRELLIDTLLERPEFADYQSLLWCDVLRVKAEFPINLWPNGAAVYHRWVRMAIAENLPFDQFAQKLLTSSGSNFRRPPVNFYRAVSDHEPSTLAEAVALTFLGERFPQWPEKKRQNMSEFFSRVGYKSTNEWKEEIIFWDRHPLDDPQVTFPDGTQTTISPDQDPRQVFADWLTSPENKRFAEVAANRVWYRLLGRGIVHPPDDFREDNPPVHPRLLDYLAGELIDSGYDLRHLYRLILNSQTYQRASIARGDDSEKAAKYFACYPMRQINAEVLEDMFRHIFEVEIRYSSQIPEPFTFIPLQERTIMLSDGSVTRTVLETFGRPSRDKGLSTDRNNAVTGDSRLFFINSTELNQWIQSSQLLRTVNGKSDRLAKIRMLWLTLLSRYPTVGELKTVETMYEESPLNDWELTRDLIWSLINTKEFSLQH
jgi:hypothetical protein